MRGASLTGRRGCQILPYLKMLRRILQWLKSLWEKFLGLFFQPQIDAEKTQPASQSLPPLTDTDYDFLFAQLLDVLPRVGSLSACGGFLTN